MLPITQLSKGKCQIKRSPKKNNSPIKKYRNFLNSLLHKAKPLSRLTRIFLSKLNPVKSSQIFNCLSKIIKASQNCNRLKLCRLFSQISKPSLIYSLFSLFNKIIKTFQSHNQFRHTSLSSLLKLSSKVIKALRIHNLHRPLGLSKLFNPLKTRN
jgi:hypothetical protein